MRCATDDREESEIDQHTPLLAVDFELQARERSATTCLEMPRKVVVDGASLYVRVRQAHRPGSCGGGWVKKEKRGGGMVGRAQRADFLGKKDKEIEGFLPKLLDFFPPAAPWQKKVV